MGYAVGKNPNSRNGFKVGCAGSPGEKNIKWKGDLASIGAIHKWIEYYRGIPRHCEHCQRTDKKKYEWANIDHKYRRVIEDYIRLCTSCHRKHDYENHLSNIGSRGGSIKNKV